MADSTNINQLPTEPASGGSINPLPQHQPNSTQIPTEAMDNSQVMALDNSTIQQIVNGIQKATSTGSTALPSRDIPFSDESYTTDAQQNINYVPEEKKYDLDIKENEDEVIQQYKNYKNNEQWYEQYYNLLQTPLLIAILFFLFQIPVVKKTFVTNLPFFVKADGNLNLNGMIVYSLLFASIYFSFSKLLL